MKVISLFCLLILSVGSLVAGDEESTLSTKTDSAIDDLSISRYQVVGTHNSYHIAPGPTEMTLIKTRGEDLAKSLEYTHLQLSEQFEMGIRQIELDLFPDPEGGKFANPQAFAAAKQLGLDAPEPHDPKGRLLEPGTKILHYPGFDFRTTVLTLEDGLKEISQWSKKNPTHHPIFILLELKEDAGKWDNEMIRSLESEILNIIDLSHFITPDAVRGDHPNLTTAIQK